MRRVLGMLLVLTVLHGLPASAEGAFDARLLRERYHSEVTGKDREYYLFLPKGYGADPKRQWPLMLFLHGAGERGDGRADLEKVLAHGPLMEAWIQRRDLPFVMIVPQAPYPDDRANAAVSPPGFAEKRDTSAAPPRLTGISMGGFGAFGIAAAHPDLFAAIAPISGAGDLATLDALASSQRPLWIIHGGRDRIVAPIESLRMANALLAKGHRAVRFSVHHDLDHDVWIRVYAGEDFYAWLLEQSLADTERTSDLH